MMGEPLVVIGAVQVMTTLLMLIEMVGALGWAGGVALTIVTVVDDALYPIILRASTLNW